MGLAGTLTLAVLLVLLALAASLSTMYVISRPLRRLEAVVRKLAGGDHAARAAVSGPAEVRALGRSVNELARQRDRLRAEEAESNRLRAQAREAGLRIREHLVADEVLREAYLALEANLDAEVVSLRLVHDGELGPRLGDHRERELPTDLAVSRIPNFAWDRLYDLFRRQRCAIFNDLRGKKAEQARAAFAPPVYEAFLRSGVVGILMTPFGVGSDMLGLIVAQRLHADHRWSPAEVDMVESIAADLGRGLNHARLYEAENRLVEELKELNRAKSDFFATTSHELRSPLTTIEGYAEMLGDGEAGEITPQQRKMLDVIDRSSVQLRNLIEDLFTLSKLESGAANTVMQPVDLGGVVANAVDSVQPSVTPAQLTLTCRVPEDKLVVSGDTSQLERVVVNLLTNAVKYTPPGGLVHVTAHAAEKSAVVSIRDTGIGIPEGDQQKLFSRFFRASNATTSRIPGTGLGLAIIHTIVSQHGGDVTLTSREGAGTVATVTLPLLVPAASTDPVTSQGPRVPER